MWKCARRCDIIGINWDLQSSRWLLNGNEKWKIENSWGEDIAYEGYYVASDSWFDNYVYQAVVNKKYLSEAELAMLKQEPIELNPWDPMGTLAK